MTWFQFFIFTSLLWWLVFFMALPIGVKTAAEAEEASVAGQEQGAPSKPLLRKKAFYTTLVTIAVGLLVKYTIDNTGVSL